jgi:hypothetical protein
MSSATVTAMFELSPQPVVPDFTRTGNRMGVIYVNQQLTTLVSGVLLLVLCLSEGASGLLRWRLNGLIFAGCWLVTADGLWSVRRLLR